MTVEIDDYQQESYSFYLNGLDNDIAYDFVINLLPVGDDIDDISNYYYRIIFGFEWGEGDVGYQENLVLHVGTDIGIGEENQYIFSHTFNDFSMCKFQLLATFYRTDTPPPYEGEWQTTMYVDCAVHTPEPSMFLMILVALPLVSRRIFSSLSGIADDIGIAFHYFFMGRDWCINLSR